MGEYKGWGPWKKVWLSACSQHQRPAATCRRCKNGGWSNLWMMVVSQWTYAFSPTLWRWWVNRGRRKG